MTAEQDRSVLDSLPPLSEQWQLLPAERRRAVDCLLVAFTTEPQEVASDPLARVRDVVTFLNDLTFKSTTEPPHIAASHAVRDAGIALLFSKPQEKRTPRDKRLYADVAEISKALRR